MNDIYIFEALFDTESKEFENNLKTKNVIKNILNVDIIIEKIREIVKNINDTTITLHLIANILDENENIFCHNNITISIEDMIGMLNKVCYNKDNIIVKFNKKVIYKTYENSNEKDKTINSNDKDKIIIRKEENIYKKFESFSKKTELQ